MNLHEIYEAAQIARNQISGDFPLANTVICSQSEFDDMDTNSYPTGTIFMIWSDSE